MCTVTYIPSGENFFISSNRDEKNTRGRAISPIVHDIGGKRLVFPKDSDAGGTWIVLNENGNVAVLLNGAFETHVPTPPYAESRGLILLKVIADPRPLNFFNQLDLLNIEPFTLILVDGTDLYECRWDGMQKHCSHLKKHRPYIWSSATLYGSEVMKKREQWFAKFLSETPQPTQKDILKFHLFTGDGDAQNDLLMSRAGAYSTVSVSSIMLTDSRGSMKYIDITGHSETEAKIELVRSFQLS